MKICVVRHGETDWVKEGRFQGRTDIPMNATGEAESEKVGRWLKDFAWEEIISSPLVRAKRTAEIIAAEIGLAGVREEFGFIERNYGKAEGMATYERKAVYSDDHDAIDGVEKKADLRERVFGAFVKYALKYANTGKNFIIVSHGAAINALLAVLSKNEIGSGKTNLKISCVTMLEVVDGEINILFYNKTAEELTA